MVCSRREAGIDKLPVRSVVILCLCMTLNSYTLVNLFPYVGLMVKGLLGLETINEAGNYAGFVASSFTFGRFVGGYATGYVIDAVGRKPVIVGGLVSIIIFSLSFGLSTSFAVALLSRLLLGLTNGIAAAVRTTTCDVCGQKHVVEAMTYLNACRSVSLILGSGIGGLLAQPAVNYPSLFDSSGVFGRYPFLLPNLVGASAGFILLVVVLIYIPETRYFEEERAAIRATSRAAETDTCSESGIVVGATSENSIVKRGRLPYQELTDDNEGGESSGETADWPDVESHKTDITNNKSAHTTNGQCDDGDGNGLGDKEEDGRKEPPTSVLAVPNVKMVLVLSCITQALVVGFEEAFPLWALSTPDVGGLGWGTIEIGKVFIAAGGAMSVMQLFVFPRVIKFVNVTTWQRTGCLLAIPAFALVPFSGDLSWNDTSLFLWTVTTSFFVYCFTAMIGVTLTIASTTMVRADMRGKLSGMFNMASSFGRAIGPAGFAVIFAWSISPSAYDWVGHEFLFFMAALAMALVSAMAWRTITEETTMTLV